MLYVPSAEALTIWWDGFFDSESGLMEFDISLMLGTSCKSEGSLNMTTTVENISLPPTSSNHTYLELELQVMLFSMFKFYHIHNYIKITILES